MGLLTLPVPASRRSYEEPLPILKQSDQLYFIVENTRARYLIGIIVPVADYSGRRAVSVYSVSSHSRHPLRPLSRPTFNVVLGSIAPSPLPHKKHQSPYHQRPLNDALTLVPIADALMGRLQDACECLSMPNSGYPIRHRVPP